ncbi:MAG: tetratricopeptide repeat protein [Maricaulaceae bacterium]
MARFMILALAAGLIGAATSVQAAELVLGKGLAEKCYENAILERFSANALDDCDAALNAGDLGVRDRAATLVNRGIILKQTGRVEDALESYGEALQLRPDMAEAYLNRGAVFLQLNRFVEAIDAINAGLGLDPEQPARGYFNRGLAYEELGDVEAAYNDYVEASRLAPEWGAPVRELERFNVLVQPQSGP